LEKTLSNAKTKLASDLAKAERAVTVAQSAGEIAVKKVMEEEAGKVTDAKVDVAASREAVRLNDAKLLDARTMLQVSGTSSDAGFAASHD
jgi:uncharacterized protein with ATP-grasp and redox domains